MKRTALLLPFAAVGIAAALALAGQAQAGPRIQVGITFGPQPTYRPYLPPAYPRHPGVGLRVAFPVRAVPAVPVAPVPFAPVAPVAPAPIAPIPPRQAHYHVMYRECSYSPWVEYGAYDCHELAHQIERRLQCAGYQARVVHH